MASDAAKEIAVSFARRRGRARRFVASLLVCAAGFGLLSAPLLAQVLPTPAPAPHPTPSVPEPPQSSAGPPAEKPWPPFAPQPWAFPSQMPRPPGPAFNIPGPPGSDPLSFCPFCGDDPREDAPTGADQAREAESFSRMIQETLNAF